MFEHNFRDVLLDTGPNPHWCHFAEAIALVFQLLMVLGPEQLTKLESHPQRQTKAFGVETSLLQKKMNGSVWLKHDFVQTL